METNLEIIVRILRGNGRTDAQNADTGRRILSELQAPEVVSIPVVRLGQVA